MQYTTAISHADALRPNDISTEQKYKWLADVDGRLGLATGIHTSNPYPDDAELMVPAPYDNVYEFYLVAMYDVYNQDVSLYQVDYALFNDAFSDAKAFLVSNTARKPQPMWKVM